MIKILITICILSLALPVVAQQSLTLTGDFEKDNYKSTIEFQLGYLYKIYYQNVGSTYKLINGKEYVPYYNRSKLKPLLLIDKKHTASISLNERKYENVYLEYDTYADELIYFDKSRIINNRLYQIALNKDPIVSFSLYTEMDSLVFRYLNSDKDIKFNLAGGFYEVVYEGNSKYIIKHQSTVHEKEGIDEYYYTPVNYISVGDKYYRIRSSRGFIKLFGDKSDEIRKFMHTSKVNIRKTDKKQIVKVLKYYDKLIMTEI